MRARKQLEDGAAIYLDNRSPSEELALVGRLSCFGNVKFKTGKTTNTTELVDTEFKGELWTGDINS